MGLDTSIWKQEAKYLVRKHLANYVPFSSNQLELKIGCRNFDVAHDNL